MATRIYSYYVLAADNSNAPVVPSSWSAGWTKTTGGYTERLTTHLNSNTSLGGTTIALNGANPSTTAFVRGVCIRPLAAQTISGNVKGQMAWREAAATDNLTSAFAIKVIQPSGADRGVLLAVSASDDTSASPPEIPITTITNRKFRDASENTSIALSSLAVSAGDYLVIEFGVRQASTSVSTTTAFSFGNSAVSDDLTEDDTDTAGNQWIEFDSDIAFLDSPSNIVYIGSRATPEDSSTATNTADPTAVVPVNGMLAGDLVVMVGQLRTAAATMTVSETGGQTWTTETAISTTNQTARVFWCVFNGTWSANPSVDFPSATCNSVHMHVFRPGGTTWTWNVNKALVELDIAAAASGTITGQTTTGTNPTVTVAGWFTADDNTWGSISGTDWGVLGTAQYRNTSSTDQSATYAYKVQTSAGATGNVTKTQLTLGNDAMTTFIITFAAVAPVVVIPNKIYKYQQAVNRAASF